MPMNPRGNQGVNLGCPMGVKIAMKDLICPGESPVYQYYLKSKDDAQHGKTSWIVCRGLWTK